MVARLALLAALFLAGCQTATVDSGFCYQNNPIRLDAKEVDALSDQLAREILQHNERGKKECGWKL